MKLINLTPHALNVKGTNGTIYQIDASGQEARITADAVQMAETNGIALYKSSMGKVTGLPNQEDGVLLIVSTLVRQALPGRKDLASPGHLIREAGQVVACTGFVIN